MTAIRQQSRRCQAADPCTGNSNSKTVLQISPFPTLQRTASPGLTQPDTTPQADIVNARSHLSNGALTHGLRFEPSGRTVRGVGSRVFRGDDIFMTNPIWFSYDYADICRALGILGFLTYVLNYTLLSLRILTSENLRYFALNILAAVLVLISLTEDFNLASALIQGFWILIGGLAILLRLRVRPTVHSGRVERAGL